MKTKFYFLALAAAAMTFTACEKDPANTGDPDSGNGGETPENPEAPAPEFSITSESTVSVPALGGDYEVTYEIKNPATGGRVTAVSDEAWVSNISTSTSGKVTFRVNQNTVTEARNATVTVTYVYGSEKLAEEVSIEQAAAEESQDVYDYDVTIKTFLGAYYGQFSAGSLSFVIILSDSDTTTGSEPIVYNIQYFVPVDTQIDFTEDRLVYPCVGTFPLSSTDYQVNTLSPGSTVKYAGATTPTLFKEGTLTVSKEGTNYIFEAELVDKNDKTHHFIYSGDGICDNPFGY